MKLNGNTYVKLDDVIECLDELAGDYERRWNGAKFDLDQYYTSGEFPWNQDKIKEMKEAPTEPNTFITISMVIFCYNIIIDLSKFTFHIIIYTNE